VVMQALTHNPLADPYLLGVSSGASVGAVAALLAGVTAALPLAAFAGALAALATTLLLAGRGASPVRMILAGVAVGYLASALVSLLVFRSSRGDAYREILSWLLGSLASSRWWEAGLALTASAVVGAVVLARSRTFDALLLGDDAAVSLGVPVRRERPWLMGLVAVLTGALVAVSGAIGFIGLVVPHAARILVGQRHRALLPVAALAGGLFLLLADTAARTLLDPVEVPVGIITALVGGPAFALLLRRVP
ncbi:MAG: iron ABC transporter permease, partial [Actinobacteria bacterium]|nr:iron ABC transporter permease [Actinomycetota bacterium]